MKNKELYLIVKDICFLLDVDTREGFFWTYIGTDNIPEKHCIFNLTTSNGSKRIISPYKDPLMAAKYTRSLLLKNKLSSMIKYANVKQDHIRFGLMRHGEKRLLFKFTPWISGTKNDRFQYYTTPNDRKWFVVKLFDVLSIKSEGLRLLLLELLDN